MDTRISTRTSVFIAIIAVMVAVLGAPAAAAPPGDIVEYPVPTSEFGGPSDIAAGPDGNLWFTAIGTSNIGRITPDGAITAFPLPILQAEAIGGLSAGPDGNLWYTANFYANGQMIGRMTPTGMVTEYPLPTAAYPRGITAGPDGNMWFTEVLVTSGPECFGCPTGTAIGRITPQDVITEYPLPKADSQPGPIATGPDGNLWFTQTNPNGIGRITPDGRITEYQLPKAGSQPGGIAAGPDGNMWFTETTWRTVPGRGSLPTGGAIGRITPQGVITEYPLQATVPRADSYPVGITAGPDGNMWFTETTSRSSRRGTVYLRAAIGRITPRGRITEYPLPEAGSGPSGITAGRDGNMWFTELNGERIGRISPTAPPAAVKYPCPVNATVHKPTPTTLGRRILTDTITTDTSTCVLPEPVVLCRPLASTTAGEKAFCDTKVTARGQIRVNTLGSQAMRVTVILRAKPKRGHADQWKPDTWRKTWLLRKSAADRNTGETDLTLSRGLVQGRDSAGVDIKAIRGATLSTSGVVTFPVTSVKGDVITHKGALHFSSSTGFVTLQNIALDSTTGTASASVQATAVPTGIQITDLLTFTGGSNQIKQNGTWTNAKVALATSVSLGNPAPLFASQLGLPAGSIATGMTIGKATITLRR